MAEFGSIRNKEAPNALSPRGLSDYLCPETKRVQGLDIHEPDYRLKAFLIEPGLNYMERAHFYPASEIRRDIYPGYAMLYVYDLPPGKLRLKTGDRMIDIAGPTALFVPPYSLIEAHYAAGWITWKAYAIERPLDSFFPERTVAFPWNKKNEIRSFANIVDILRSQHFSSSVDRLARENAVSKQVCNFVNRYFSEDLRISDIAKELKLPHSTMTHTFADHCGMTPVGYRNTLRVFKALKLIGDNCQLTDACYQAGFSDYSNFHKIFKEIIGASPLNFARKPYQIKDMTDFAVTRHKEDRSAQGFEQLLTELRADSDNHPPPPHQGNTKT